MTLKLVKLEPKYRRHLNDMMSQWYATGECQRYSDQFRKNLYMLKD